MQIAMLAIVRGAFSICLGSNGNEQGGHYFMLLATGHWPICNWWDELPMPRDAIAWVSKFRHQQGMPKALMFADQYGCEILDYDEFISNSL